MKKFKFLCLIFTLLLTVFSFSAARAQDTEEPVQEGVQNQNKAVRPFKIFQELGLTPEQIQQVRRINQERKPIMQEAQMRWRKANRELDSAIYADDSTEEQVKELTRAAQLAQAELLKEKTITEFLIRKVLTPEQLVKFRSLREQLRQRMDERKNRIQENPDNRQRPLNRFQRRMQNRRQ